MGPAHLCTASTLFISVCVYGSQTVLAYSTSGPARVNYACSFILIDGIFRFLRRLKWRPLADRRKDARLVMLYKIDRELVAINKENRLIPTGRKTRKSHNRYHIEDNAILIFVLHAQRIVKPKFKSSFQIDNIK
jgi:hypothetical protein